MVNTQKLKGLIAEKNYSQSKIAEMIGITPKTFYSRMDKGVFGSDEIDKMIEILDIKDPTPIFFAQCVTCKVTTQ